MATISVSLPTDGTTADTSDYNTPITTIVNEINGNLDNANIKSGAAIATSKLADDAGITTAKIAADAVTATKIDWASTGADGGIWWEELGRTTLGSAGDTISVTSLSARKFLRITGTLIPSGGTITCLIQYNNDSAANYSQNTSTLFGAAAALTAQTSITLRGASNNNMFFEMDIQNIAAQEKYGIAHLVERNTAGAATGPTGVEGYTKWANTAAQINRIDVLNTGAGDFAIGSDLVVLGHN